MGDIVNITPVESISCLSLPITFFLVANLKRVDPSVQVNFFNSASMKKDEPMSIGSAGEGD